MPVYSCRISVHPFNTWWPGHQRSVDQTEEASFVNLVSGEIVEIEVEPLKKSPDGKIMIKPYAKNIAWERVGDRIRIYGETCVRISVENSIPTTEYRNITVENVSLNGTRLTESEMDLSVVGCDRSILTVL